MGEGGGGSTPQLLGGVRWGSSGGRSGRKGGVVVVVGR